MAQLAIKAHPIRTKEVIEILEMLGGKNRYHFKGDEDEWFVLNGDIQRSDRLFDEKGFTLEESVKTAKEYISGALSAMLDLGKGSGPMQHNFDLQGAYAGEAE